MGWSSRTYRYEQYKNTLKLLRKANATDFDVLPDDETLIRLIHEKPQPRGDWSLWRTMAAALRELLDKYREVAVAEFTGDDDIHFRCTNCGCEMQNSDWSNGERCYIEWNYCPECGCEFVEYSIVEELDGSVMTCSNCAHCVSEGYEYPEYYCELGIGDYDEKRTADGCNYTRAERIEMCKGREGLWWDESK